MAIQSCFFVLFYSYPLLLLLGYFVGGFSLFGVGCVGILLYTTLCVLVVTNCLIFLVVRYRKVLCILGCKCLMAFSVFIISSLV
jgi:hypothetical protein